MITGNTHNKFNDDKTCGSEDMIADRLKTFFLQILPTAAFLFLFQNLLHYSPDLYGYF